MQYTQAADRHVAGQPRRAMGRLQPGSPGRRHCQPRRLSDRRGALHGPPDPGACDRWADRAYRGHAAQVERLVRKGGARRTVDLRPQPAVGDHGVAADPQEPETHDPDQLPRGGHERTAVGRCVLLSRWAHALVERVPRGPFRSDARAGTGPVLEREQPQLSPEGSDRPEARAAGTAVVRRDGRLLERRHAGGVDGQGAGLDDLPLDVRIQQRDGSHRGDSTQPGRERSPGRSHFLRSGGIHSPATNRDALAPPVRSRRSRGSLHVDRVRDVWSDSQWAGRAPDTTHSRRPGVCRLLRPPVGPDLGEVFRTGVEPPRELTVPDGAGLARRHHRRARPLVPHAARGAVRSDSGTPRVCRPAGRSTLVHRFRRLGRAGRAAAPQHRHQRDLGTADRRAGEGRLPGHRVRPSGVGEEHRGSDDRCAARSRR